MRALPLLLLCWCSLAAAAVPAAYYQPPGGLSPDQVRQGCGRGAPSSIPPPPPPPLRPLTASSLCSLLPLPQTPQFVLLSHDDTITVAANAAVRGIVQQFSNPGG